jgi:hypothetical protein
MREADLLPEMTAVMKIGPKGRVVGDDEWEVIDMFVTSKPNSDGQTPDESYVGRKIGYFLGQEKTNNWRGVTDLLMALQLQEVPERDGEQNTLTAFEGVEVECRITKDEVKVRNNARPVIDWDWVNKDYEGEGGGKPAGRKTRKKKAAGSRRRRRSA